MTWNPNLEDTEERKGGGSLLFKAHSKVPGIIINRLEDDVGIFALNLVDYVLVAKDYIYGNIVSCHKAAIYSALNQKKNLLMYIGKNDKFYKFNPQEIINNNKGENQKGSATMVNFDIRIGERYEI